jgi:hypothetical protein
MDFTLKDIEKEYKPKTDKSWFSIFNECLKKNRWLLIGSFEYASLWKICQVKEEKKQVSIVTFRVENDILRRYQKEYLFEWTATKDFKSHKVRLVNEETQQKLNDLLLLTGLIKDDTEN